MTVHTISAKHKKFVKKALAYFIIFIGLPLFVLITVFVSATAVILMVSWCMGWL